MDFPYYNQGMHYIQKHILDELRTVDTMRYTQLNTKGVESGHFRYHLSQLVQDGYVEQLERGVYGLTHSGQQYVDKLSANTVNSAPMPKVITYTLLRDGDKILLQRKPKQPYMGLLNMIGGKLHHGESAQQAATREVCEKTGTSINPPKSAGIFEVLISKDDKLLTHVVAYVFIADIDATDFDDPSITLLDTSKLSDAQLAPDLLPIFDLISDDSKIHTDCLEIEA